VSRHSRYRTLPRDPGREIVGREDQSECPRSDRAVATTRVLICSPIRLYCEGLAKLLGAEANFEVATAPLAYESWVGDVAQMDADVVLVDLALPESVEAITAMTETATGTPIVALSVAQDEGAVVDCVRAGVTAFVSREATVEDLRRAVVLAARGESPAPTWLMPILLRRVAAGGDGGSSAGGPLQRLTRREHEVLGLVADGLSNKQIAGRLCIELPTVKNHVHNILEKLEVSRRAEAVARVHGARAHTRI
jgi:two-component system nitrate/nitrite response regulator NarL